MAASIPAVIPAVFALLGVIVANWWTFKQQMELFDREHKARQKELSLQRGEERPGGDIGAVGDRIHREQVAHA
jgi:hypothetical protein